MQAKHYLATALVALLTFVGGFLLANSLNRAETERMRSEIEKSAQKTASQGDLELTETEIDSKVAEADARPQDLLFQKNLGIALYRYGAMKQDVGTIEKAIKLLERANKLNPNDVDILIALGNAHFDIGYFNKVNNSLEKARSYYDAAVKIRPQDVELRTDLGLTYFLQQPSDLEKASSEFDRALAINPEHEKTLQFYIQTLAKQNNAAKASELIERLRKANPQNPALPELASIVNSAAAQK